MATSRVKTWVTNETLTSADLNAEFDNLLNGAIDLNGSSLTFDTDADTYIVTSTDDRIDFYFKSVDLMHFDGSATTPVNGFDIAFGATGSAATITARGDSNLGVNFVGAGTGKLESEGDSVLGLYGQELYLGR